MATLHFFDGGKKLLMSTLIWNHKHTSVHYNTNISSTVCFVCGCPSSGQWPLSVIKMRSTAAMLSWQGNSLLQQPVSLAHKLCV